MHQIISETFYFILDVVLFLIGLSWFFFMVSTQNDIKSNVQDAVNKKSNVFEMGGEYAGTELSVQGSSIPGDILQYDQNLKVVIGGYTVTDSAKEALKNYYDVSEILSRVSLDRSYRKSYEFDEDGHIIGVIYQ